jgi:hypothetical protein
VNVVGWAEQVRQTKRKVDLKILSRFGEGGARRLFVALLAFLLLGENAVRAADEGNSPAGLTVYSDLNFIETEREFVGLQVAIVPFHDGQKLLWRSAGPFLNTPLLLDVVMVGNALRVVVPDEDDDAGVWNLSLKGNVLYAVGPKGLKYSLKRISLK